MWLFSIFNLLYILFVTFLPVILDTGLQVWNGIKINSTDFSRTPEWSKESFVVPPENIPGPVRNAPYSSSTDASIKFPDPSLEEENIFPRTIQAGASCRVDEFTCDDGQTCLPWEKICDGISNCPQTEDGNGGEDEVVLDNNAENEGSDYEGSGMECIRPPKPVSTTPSPVSDSKNYVEIDLGGNLKFLISLETIVSLALLQLPAVCLAFYGVFCALKQPNMVDKFTDSLLALTIMFLPFCLIEFFALLEFEFARSGVNFLANSAKSCCQSILDSICSGCSDKAAARLDLLKFLPSKDPTGRDRALSVEAAKLVAGSCLQLVFQAVLLGGYTSWDNFEVSQGISIISSALMIIKVAVDIVIYQRAMNKPDTVHKQAIPLKERLRIRAGQQMDSLKKFLVALPLLLTSLVFHSGTLVLTILVTEWFSAVYIGLVLLLNLALSSCSLFNVVEKTEKKLGLTYKFSKLSEDREARRVKETRIVRGLFSSWANLFILLRPVENMSYHKVTHAVLLQPIRFIVNIITLVVLVGLTWTSVNNHTQVQNISLIVAFCIVFAAGIVNLLELFCYFYFGNHICLTKPPAKTDPIELQDIEQGPADTREESANNVQFGDSTVEERSHLLSSAEPAVEGQAQKEKASKEESTDESAANKEDAGSSGEVGKIEPVELIQEETEEKANESSDDAASTDKEEDDEEKETTSCLPKESPAILTSVSDTAALRPPPKLTTQVSVRSVREVFFDDDHLDIVDSTSALSKEEVKQTITDIQEQGGMVDKEKFIETMMAFFPNYNMDVNRMKLDKLFDRLDLITGSSTGLITFRQFLLVTVAFSNIPLEDKLIKIFKLIDENGDKELSFGEFEETVKDILVLKEERKISNTLVEEKFTRSTFEHMGMNADGKVDLRDFVEACTRQHFIIINYVENFKDDFLVK